MIPPTFESVHLTLQGEDVAKNKKQIYIYVFLKGIERGTPIGIYIYVR